MGIIFEYHLSPIRLDGCDLILVWSEDVGAAFDGGYLNDGGGRLHVFHSAEEARAAAEARGLAPSDDDSWVRDLDAVIEWLAAPSTSSVPCTQLWDVLGFFGEVASTLRLPFWVELSAQRDDFDKLRKAAWSNPDSTLEDGETWTEHEIALIARALGEGLRSFRTALHPGELGTTERRT
jgi:hypothetical protein